MDAPGQALETELAAAASGNSVAMTHLLASNSRSLVRFVARRLDSRLTARVEPADVVQDVLLFACRNLRCFLERCPLPFTMWLQQLAREQIAYVHRWHIRSRKRSVCRELRNSATDSFSQSAIVNRIRSSEPSADKSLELAEQRAEVRQRVQRLPASEQMLLRLRFVERLKAQAIAEKLGITAEAVRMRQIRALRHLRQLMEAAP